MDVRQAILQAHNYKCFYTGASLPPSQLEIDHIVPLSKGGANDIYNMVPCRKELNGHKDNMVLSQLQTLVELNKPFAEKAIKMSCGKKPRLRKHKSITIGFDHHQYQQLINAAMVADRRPTSFIKLAIKKLIQEVENG